MLVTFTLLLDPAPLPVILIVVSPPQEFVPPGVGVGPEIVGVGVTVGPVVGVGVAVGWPVGVGVAVGRVVGVGVTVGVAVGVTKDAAVEKVFLVAVAWVVKMAKVLGTKRRIVATRNKNNTIFLLFMTFGWI